MPSLFLFSILIATTSGEQQTIKLEEDSRQARSSSTGDVYGAKNEIELHAARGIFLSQMHAGMKQGVSKHRILSKEKESQKRLQMSFLWRKKTQVKNKKFNEAGAGIFNPIQ